MTLLSVSVLSRIQINFFVENIKFSLAIYRNFSWSVVLDSLFHESSLNIFVNREWKSTIGNWKNLFVCMWQIYLFITCPPYIQPQYKNKKYSRNYLLLPFIFTIKLVIIIHEQLLHLRFLFLFETIKYWTPQENVKTLKYVALNHLVSIYIFTSLWIFRKDVKSFIIFAVLLVRASIQGIIIFIIADKPILHA